MILDSSAIVAIFFKEPGYEELLDRLTRGGVGWRRHSDACLDGDRPGGENRLGRSECTGGLSFGSRRRISAIRP